MQTERNDELGTEVETWLRFIFFSRGGSIELKELADLGHARGYSRLRIWRAKKHLPITSERLKTFPGKVLWRWNNVVSNERVD